MTQTPPRGLALVLGLLAAFGPLSIDMYLPALPEIGRELRGDPAATLAVFFAGMAAGQLVHGPLADRFGRRLPLLAAVALYTLASGGCALAATMGELSALRLLQALGACAGMVVARAVVRDLADQVDPMRLMARLMLVMGVAPILAPLAGGWVAAAFGWRAIFWALALVGALAFLVVALFLPDTLPRERRRRVPPAAVLRDYAGLLADARFVASALPGAAAISGLFAFIAGSPGVFIGLFGVAPERFGIFFGAGAAGVIAASLLAGRLAPRLGRERLFGASLLVLALTALPVVAAAAAGIGFWPFWAALLVHLAALGAVLPLSSVLAVQPFPRMAGTASALFGAMQFSLGALAGALLAALPAGALPMAAVMAGCAWVALGSRMALRARAAARTARAA
jgi:DHA1 family bicyclomycin/chloramphenicol resistance-like MFS transporter